ncbi:delta-class carbonic anhydrase [Viridibacterium curvum]|uniref:Cadmium carbonic anhydrase n=1 Tax=Viridibacterium curvum TaxID=1101404 RepID=A0ABP9QMY4_9RHOO
MHKCLPFIVLLSAFAGSAHARTESPDTATTAIAAQDMELERNTDGKGFGPQSPRDLGKKKGENQRIFSPAPAYQKMNLCNIHFHTNAEHKGGEFTTFAGYGDGHGGHTGFRYNGKLSAAEAKPLSEEVCKSEHGGLQAGDTIELHYVHSTAMVAPGPTLNSCLSETDINPQLRVEAQVMVLVNDSKAINFNRLAEVGQVNGFHQALNIPKSTGRPIQYAGSTTGPAYNEKGSPLQVSWSVRPRVLKVSAESVGKWCSDNVFKEDHAHGVRNLVRNTKLLSPMK